MAPVSSSSSFTTIIIHKVALTERKATLEGFVDVGLRAHDEVSSVQRLPPWSADGGGIGEPRRGKRRARSDQASSILRRRGRSRLTR